MKIQLDTTNKTIRLEESVNLGEFIAIIKQLLPNGDYMQYTLDTSPIVNWQSPLIVKEYPIKPYYPTGVPWITYTGHTYRYNAGTYNIEI
jgi:hypothetical protein